MSKLWGVLRHPYLLSLTYLATVVLVAADVAPTVALPVLQRLLDRDPHRSAAGIKSVATDPPDQPTLIGATLVVFSGSGLSADHRRHDPPLGIGPGGARPRRQVPPPQAVRVTLDDTVPAGLHGAERAAPLHRGPGRLPRRRG